MSFARGQWRPEDWVAEMAHSWDRATGGHLSPRFVEWMQMLPEGWVTDVVAGRTAALRMLGNGVVPAQAAYAIRALAAEHAS